MNLTALEYILAIEQNGSLSKAAQQLYVSQPYLSKLLHETEKAYGITIFTRGARRMQVTEQGKTFLEMAWEMVQGAKRFDRMFQTNSSPKTLRIATFPSSYAVGAYSAMLQDMGEDSLRIHFHEESTFKVIRDVASRNAELGLIFLKEERQAANEAFFQSRRIVCRKLFETRPHIFVREGHPLTRMEKVTREDLYRFSLIAFASTREADVYTLDDGYYNSNSTPELLDYDRFRKITYIYDRGTWISILRQTDSIAIGNQLTEDRFGFRFIPFPFEEKDKNAASYNNTLYCIWQKDRPLSSLAQQYLEYLQRYYALE